MKTRPPGRSSLHDSMKRTTGYRLALCVLVVLLGGCMRWEYGETETLTPPGKGLFVLCEGLFQYGNASLSCYDPETGAVENEVFRRVNGFKLGDVAQSMTVRDGVGWIVVNNSHVVFAIDLETYREVGRITDLTSPRYIHFLSDEKAYISQLWDNRIFIVNPRRFEITGYITCPGMTMETGSTEQMVQQGKYVYVNCWSYQNRILKIDTERDEVVGELEVGIQPTSLALDRRGKLWTVTGGGYEGSPYGYEAPSLCRIDPERFVVEQTLRFRLGDSPSELQTDGSGERLYWLDDDVWSMAVTEERLPARPFLESRGTKYYGLTVDLLRGDVYVADAVDHQQPGVVYRYAGTGELLDEFRVGVSPGAFAWR